MEKVKCFENKVVTKKSKLYENKVVKFEKNIDL